MSKVARKSLSLILLLITGLCVLWCSLAIWVDSEFGPWLKGLIIAILVVLSLASVLGIRPLSKGCILPLSLCLATLAWWVDLKPRNDRDWATEYARLASSSLTQRQLTVNNVRHFHYRSVQDFDPRWETRTYNLDELKGVDIFFSFWGPRHIAHTIVSWQFENAPPLAISIETRREQNESFSGLRGFFRQFELYYVVADESDLIRLRTDIRQEDVYLYRINMEAKVAEDLLLEYFRHINTLHDKPRWYNAGSQNCTTMIRHHLQAVAGEKPWTWRLLFNGYLPELAHQQGTFNKDLPFEEFQKKSRISDKAKQMDKDQDYSTVIRTDLP